MTPINREQFATLLKQARIKPRIQKILRFVPEEITQWEARDFLRVIDKSGREGVLIVDSTVYPFTLHPRVAKATGQTAAIICDICATWRRGTESAVITFASSDRRSVSFLVCADLDCSLHVRGLTTASTLSRAQLREDISPHARVARLQKRLDAMLATI